MEKTNELNKFLSYVHMGNATFRIYHEKALRLENIKLIELIIQIKETFKVHEETITNLINDQKEEATNSITCAGRLALTMEKMRTYDTDFKICYHAIKATNSGLTSALKFLNENSRLDISIKSKIVKIIEDYNSIIKWLTKYIIDNCS